MYSKYRDENVNMGEKVIFNEPVRIKRGEVVGIGKIKIPQTADFSYEIPMLSFLAVKKDDGTYVSTCIHLLIDGYGKTVEDAQDEMTREIYYFLRENFSKIEDGLAAWDNLESYFVEEEISPELWRAYRKVQIRLSMQGKSTDSVKNLKKRIDQLEQRVEQLESEEAHRIGGKLSEMRAEPIIDYASIERKAA